MCEITIEHTLYRVLTRNWVLPVNTGSARRFFDDDG